MPKVTFISQNGETVITAESGALLSDLLLSGGSPLEMPCGGKGRCGKCRVRAEGALSKATADEAAALRPDELSAGIRLACCTRLLGDAAVWTANRLEEGQIQLLAPLQKSPISGVMARQWTLGQLPLPPGCMDRTGRLVRRYPLIRSVSLARM